MGDQEFRGCEGRKSRQKFMLTVAYSLSAVYWALYAITKLKSNSLRSRWLCALSMGSLMWLSWEGNG